MLPLFVTALPGFIARLAGARNGVGAPGLFAGIEIGRLDEAADAELAAGGAHDREVADDQRRHRQSFAERRIGDLALPGDLTGRFVDREHASVERDRDHLVFPQRDAAIVHAAACNIAGPSAVYGGIHLPLDHALLAGCEIDRVHRAPAIRHVHDAVLDERGSFEVAMGVAPATLQSAETDREGEPQVLRRAGVDLIQ